MKTRPWPTAGLLTALVFVGYLPISVVSILGPILVEDLNISAPTFGLGPSLLFGGAAVITLVMAGSRAAMRQRMVGALLAAAAGWLIVSMAQGKFEYFLGLILCSGALAMCIPAVNQSAQMLVSSSARGAVVGFAQSGSQIAAIATGLLVPWGFDRLGWRSTVLIASAGAVVVAALTRFVIPSGSRNLREVPGRARTVTNRVAVRPGLWGYPLLMGIVTTPLFVYLPTHLVDVTKIDLMHAGWVVLGNAGVAMAAKILWGKLTYHTGRPACAMSVISLGTFVGYLLMASSSPSRVCPG